MSRFFFSLLLWKYQISRNNKLLHINWSNGNPNEFNFACNMLFMLVATVNISYDNNYCFFIFNSGLLDRIFSSFLDYRLDLIFCQLCIILTNFYTIFKNTPQVLIIKNVVKIAMKTQASFCKNLSHSAVYVIIIIFI
jgi:hypothetical protein